MNRVTVRPELLRWACERAGHSVDSLAHRFPKLPDWERGDASPTLKQLESFAKATFTPVGFLFLDKPPVETLPIPDFRSGRGLRTRRPSPHLLDTLYICQQRQEWYHDFARTAGEEPLPFIGSVTVRAPIKAAAQTIRDALGFDLNARRTCRTWEEALGQFIDQVDTLGILVMRNGVVHNNTHRKLDPHEFRGFTLVDSLAPLVFLNGADSKAAQMFTLAHELGHLWLGRSALDDAEIAGVLDDAAERWCNEVAAELLVPMDALHAEIGGTVDIERDLVGMARTFKVSTLVILRRIYDGHFITREIFREAYESELARLPQRAKAGGGDFYLTEISRVGRRFASALVGSTLEGHTLYLEAFRMLGISKAKTFNELGRHLQFAI